MPAYRSLILIIGLLFSSHLLADANEDLSGQYFGKIQLENGRLHRGPKREVALLLNAIAEEPGSYYGVVYEYLNPLVEKNFIPNFVRPGKKKWFSKKRNTYLQELLQWVQVYKFVKNVSHGNVTYSAYQLKVENGEIKIAQKTNDYIRPSIFAKRRNPLKNAWMNIKVGNNTTALIFKKKRRFPLKSTWDKNYTPGPYNPGYKQSNVTILDLMDDFNLETKTATAKFDVKELKGMPMVIKGEFEVKEAQKGMFIFKDISTTYSIGAKLVEDKIGVFIDVYNARPIMNTVELILIDPANNKNAQMYFEKYGNKTK
jgi:hypothetical protein